jgi:hypothetical protein
MTSMDRARLEDYNVSIQHFHDLSVAKNPSIYKIRKFHELRTCAWIVLKVVDRGCYEQVTFRFLFVTARCNPAMRNTRVGYLVEPSKIGRRRIIGERHRSETWTPSFNSSPWMRGAPQVEFSCAIVWIMDRISPDVVGLPTVLLRERKRQYRRKPCRCHSTTVSGLTIRSDLAQCGQKWRSRIQNSRSERCNRGRLLRRFKTINWCRKATISRPRSWRDRTKLCSQVNTAVTSPCINSLLYQYERLHC